ncbi:MAG: galactitol-1-phosphate 5-dehydrogenase [Anaerolineae bacterium]
MKALMLEAYHQLSIVDVPTPTPDPGEVLIRVQACGICGSDVHGLDGSTGRRQPPIIMGHEASGVIEQVGPGVTEWRAGDRVTFDSTISCGRCFFCRRGQANLCDNRQVLGVSCDEYRRHGAFAEYVVVPETVLYRLPDGVSFVQAAMVEPVSVALHAVGRAKIAINDTAVVVGAGMIGLFLIQALRLAGCGSVIAVDLVPEKLDLARRLGADITLRSDQDDVPGLVRELTEGRGADLAFEAVGITPTVRLAIQTLRKGGTAVLVGNLSPTVELPLQAVVTQEITVLSSCAINGEYAAALDLIDRGAINVDALVSATAPLEEGPGWFERLYRQEPGLLKVVLQP